MPAIQLNDAIAHPGFSADFLTHPDAYAEASGVLAASLVEALKQQGASAAEVSLGINQGLDVQVRMGDVESIEFNRDRSASVVAYFGQSKGVATTNDLSETSLQATLNQACAIAKFTEADPYAGLADAHLMAADFDELGRWHPNVFDAKHAADMAKACEEAGRGYSDDISNSDGAGYNGSAGLGVYANSHDFVGHRRSTKFGLSCVLIAGTGDAMKRNYSYDSRLNAEWLHTPQTVGAQAAERTLASLNPKPIQTGQYPVLFHPELSGGLMGQLVAAVSGRAQYRKASFLLDAVGTQVLPSQFGLLEQPRLPEGLRSANFDADGVGTATNPLVEGGVLGRYVLSSYSARRLGLTPTANAGGVRNLCVQGADGDLNAFISGMKQGLLVTQLMGQGVNPITGDYSRGASGFWIENGEIIHPVDEITIAGNLKDMLLGIEAIGTDVDHRSSVQCGTIHVGQMMVAG